MYSVILTPSAKRDLKKLSSDIQEKIIEALKEIRNDPFEHVKKLQGVDLYSLRVGEYRVVMSFDGNNYIIYVIEIGNRNKVYRKYS
jgi:mRNA interferase RelE/StbE